MRLYTSELVKKYKARTVVDHVSIDVNQGEIVGLLGPNGAGKTTTFYMIVGLIKPNEGRIFLEDDEGKVAELTKEPVYKRAQMGVGYLAQEASVFRRLSVEDNIRAVLEMTDFSKEYQTERVECADRGVPPAKGSQEPRHPAFGRRTAPHGDRARGGHQPGVHPARRALRGRRPHRRGGHPVDRGDAQAQEHRRHHHRPQRRRDARPSPTAPTCSTRARSSRRVRPRNWPPTRWFARSTSASISSSRRATS